MSTEQKAALADVMVDDMCEHIGVRGTIRYLLDYLSPQEVIAMRFDEKDVNDVLEEKYDIY